MFNSPFDSFQKIVAEAKQEREQLDRLLTISTPRERTLLSLTAVAVLLFGGWLFMGSAAHTIALDGMLISDEASLSNHRVQAVVWLDADLAETLEAGMMARLRAGDGPDIQGRIVAVSGLPLPEPLSRIETPDNVPMRHLEIALPSDAMRPSHADGAPCKVVVSLGTLTPATLLGL